MVRKNEALVECRTILKAIHPMLVDAGLKTALDEIPSEHKAKEVQKCLKFLNDFRSTEIAAVIKIKALVADEVWDTYRDMGITGLQEQRLLSSANKVLRGKWCERPSGLKPIPKPPKTKKKEKTK